MRHRTSEHLPIVPTSVQGIIRAAGEPGDRRFASRKGSGREESPDSSCGELARAGHSRATRLVTPGGRAARFAKAGREVTATESATENETAGDACTSAAGLRQNQGPASFGQAHLARVKRWGKSPPPGWRHPGHGKPRVEQGQIGGESRPGSLGPSGRLLEARSDARPRGMITASRLAGTHRIRLIGPSAI